MAEISIPLSVKLGDLSALSSLQRQVDETKRKLTSLGEFEELPGGGIRRRGSPLAQPGAGTYVTPPMASPSIPRPSTTPSPGQPPVAVPGEPFTHAMPQVSAYTRALGQVDAQTRRLFLSLRDLGQRHREQGFLGREDTRTLQTTQRAFETVSRRVESDLQGARARQTTARTETERQKATEELEGLRTRQRAMATLERQLPPPPLPPPPASPTPPGDEDDEAGPGRFRRGLHRGFQRVQGVARGALGIAAGVGVYQTLTHAMTLYEQRAAGVIATGMQLDLQFDRVGGTIDSLRSKYQVLAHDSIQAMQAMGRISGDMSAQSLARLDRSVRFGTAYGMAPAQAAMMAEHLQRTTVAGPNPLATIAATTRLLGTGITPMSTEARAEEVFSMAQRGLASGLRVPLSQYSREANLIGSMGEQYQVPGAVSQFAGQLSQGLTQSPDIGVYAMRMQALSQMRRERQARGLGTTLTHGGHTFDLTSNFDLGALMEVADQVPEVQEAFRQSALRNAGGNREAEKYLFHGMVSGEQLTRVQSENLRATVGRTPGGFHALNAPATAETAAEETRIGGRLAARRERPEFLHQAMTAQFEGGLEEVGKRMVGLGDELKKAIAELATAANSGTMDLQKLGGAMTTLSDSSRLLLGTLTALSSQSLWGIGAGIALGATGLASGVPQGSTYAIGGPQPQGEAGSTYNPRYHLGTPPPSLQPQRPGP